MFITWEIVDIIINLGRIFQTMSYNLACAELEDISDSNFEELSQSQSVVSDPDSDFVPPSSSSIEDLTDSSKSDGTQSDSNQVCTSL